MTLSDLFPLSLRVLISQIAERLAAIRDKHITKLLGFFRRFDIKGFQGTKMRGYSVISE